jgi:hypothetical protein
MHDLAIALVFLGIVILPTVVATRAAAASDTQ